MITKPGYYCKTCHRAWKAEEGYYWYAICPVCKGKRKGQYKYFEKCDVCGEYHYDIRESFPLLGRVCPNCKKKVNSVIPELREVIKKNVEIMSKLKKL